MDRKPLVSIVMPVYNAMPYLEQAVQSIYAQTLTDWELIAVDDCSTDGSWDYLQRIDDPRVRITRNNRNAGQPVSSNRGNNMAQGEFIARMDSDDLMLPSRLQKQIELLESSRKLDVVGCGLFRVKDDMSIVAVRRPPANHRRITRLLSGPWSLIHGPNFLMTDGALLGHAEWFRRWKYNSQIPYAQDFDILCRSQRASIFGNIPDPLYVYRIGAGITSSWSSQTMAVYYKAISLMKYGFHKGLILKSLLGLIALIPRPLAYVGVKTFVHGKNKKPVSFSAKVAHEDAESLQEGLAQISKVEVPLRRVS
ncbi:glycosyltransferase family 2 protein [Thermodesulfobacteriota bacterium]